jgi:hypothetical protein
MRKGGPGAPFLFAYIFFTINTIMRFTIVENLYHNKMFTHSQANEVEKFIEEHCDQFLKESRGHFLYRGMVVPQKPYAIIRMPHKNRRPSNTPEDIHHKLDEMFMKRFGWRPRSTGVFATSSYGDAEYYGDVYTIYPANGFRYLWSPDVGDLYGELNYEFSSDGTYWRNEEDIEYMINKRYKDNDLLGAIDSKHEIMIGCDFYVVVRRDY